MRHAATIAVGLFSLIAFSSPAWANSNRIMGASVSGPIYQYWVWQGPSEFLQFATSNLSSGSDTVIHVQNGDDVQHGYIAGNDDFGGTLASQVGVASVGYTRLLLVLVRSYSADSRGTCTLDVWSSSWGSWNVPLLWFGGTTWVLGGGGLLAGAHVTTVERQAGATDTVLLTLSSTAHGVAFSDDDGTGLMSSVHNPEAAEYAMAVVGTLDDTGTYLTNLVWDDDPDSTDFDSDGLGWSLEVYVLGTDPWFWDSDGDGLTDGDEVYGYDSQPFAWSPPVKLPTWGADPVQKDIFLEMDWHQCTAAACGGNLDASRTSAGAVVEAKNRFASAGVRVHFDTGQVNSDPATWNDWGAWGGASRQTQFATPDPNVVDTCWGRSIERDYRFRHAYVWGGIGIVGWAPYRPGACFATASLLPQEGKIIVHESGHNQGLHHGGRPHALAANYKPNYASIMNYTYEYQSFSDFSPNSLPTILPTLNPTSLSEADGVGTTDANILDRISETLCPGDWCINRSTGAIDWNLDRVFEPSGTVKANVLLGDTAQHARTEFTGTNYPQLNMASMAWVSIGGIIGNRLMVYGQSSGGFLQLASASGSQIASACGSIGSLSDEFNTPCAQFTDAALWPGNKLMNRGPAAAEVSGKSMVISDRPATNNIVSNILTVNGSTGQATFGADVALPGSTGLVAIGDFAAASYGSGVVAVWVPVGTASGNRLKQWSYSNGTWFGPSDQKWLGGVDIVPTAGIGVALGYDSGSSLRYTYAAIPTTGGTLEFAKQEQFGPQAGQWIRFSVANSPTVDSWQLMGSRPVVRDRPGLAYVPKPGGSVWEGKFYVAFNQNETAGCATAYGPPACNAKILMTEGNLAATGPNKRLIWVNQRPSTQDFGIGVYNNLRGGINLMYDAARDTSLRAMWTKPSPPGSGSSTAVFSPFASGIFNGNLVNLSDVDYVTGALRAALCLEPGSSWPAGVLPAGLP